VKDWIFSTTKVYKKMGTSKFFYRGCSQIEAIPFFQKKEPVPVYLSINYPYFLKFEGITNP